MKEIGPIQAIPYRSSSKTVTVNEFRAKFDKAPESVVTSDRLRRRFCCALGLGSKIIGIKPDAPMPSDTDEYAKINQLGDKKKFFLARLLLSRQSKPYCGTFVSSLQRTRLLQRTTPTLAFLSILSWHLLSRAIQRLLELF